MSRYSHEHEKVPPNGSPRPHSFDLGVHEHQAQQEVRKHASGRGVYKSGSGTYMFASTSMSAALDNLQFYPKVTGRLGTTATCIQPFYMHLLAAP